MRTFARMAALAASVAIAAPAFAQQTTKLSIGTGGTGGVYYPLGGGIANVLTKNVPGLQATAEVTGGSVDNLKLLGAGKAELGMTMADAALDSLKGEDKFTGSPVPVRTLMSLYPNRMHVVSIEGSGVEKMADLKGKRISTGSPGSATEVMAFRVLDAAGLDKDKDVKRERLGVAESVNAVKDKKIDAFFWVGGLPTAAVTDLGATPGVKIRMIDHADATAKMNAKYGPLYSEDVIKTGTYPGQAKDNKVVTVWNLLVVHEKMPDKLAYDILKTIFDKKAELVTVHKEAENFDVKNQAGRSSIPWHPAAIKFFGEKGVKLN
ncbi:MAG: TAXI family TRAP transporter solute-binding subunit [Rhodospirillales bacterium]|nr:TAXI family TRAP transporter solute-binding subunit [Rhodospirillales bacterium]